jgi:hypothetical protein
MSNQVLSPLTPILIAPGVPEPRPTPLAGDVTGTTLASTVIKVEGNLFEPVKYGAQQDGEILTWVNSANEWEAKPAPVGFTAGGDLAGTATSQIVTKIQGNLVLSGALGAAQDGYALTWVNSNGEWIPKPTSPIYPNIGVGLATAVGFNVSGIPVRITDPTCVSGLNFIGDCDAAGNITAHKRTAIQISVLEWGFDPNGWADNSARLETLFTYLRSTPTKECFVHFPEGIYRFNSGWSSVPSGVWITGAGQGSAVYPRIYTGVGTTLAFFGSGAAITFNTNGTSANGAHRGGLRDLCIAACNPDGYASYPNISEFGVEIIGDNNVTLSNLRIGMFKYGISVDGSQVTAINNINFDMGPVPIYQQNGGLINYPGYADMSTDRDNVGGAFDSSVCLRIGEWKFLVAGSANSCWAEKMQFNGSRWGTWHHGGLGHTIRDFTSEQPGGYSVVDSVEQLDISTGGGEGYNLHGIAGIWFRPGSLALNVSIDKVQFGSTKPAIQNDGIIYGLQFIRNFVNAVNGIYFPLDGNGTYSDLHHFGNLLPTNRPQLMLNMSGSSGYGMAGTPINHASDVQAALDVSILDSTISARKHRSSNHTFIEERATAYNGGTNQTYKRVFSSTTSGPAAVNGECIGWVLRYTTDAPTVISTVEILNRTSGWIEMIAVGNTFANDGNVAMFKIKQAFAREDYSLTYLILLGSPVLIETTDPFDGAYPLPTLTVVGSGQSVPAASAVGIGATVAAHPTKDINWAVTMTIHSTGR